ncbi:hypothetical protein GCM10009534_39120 [Kribbella sandramycini]
MTDQINSFFGMSPLLVRNHWVDCVWICITDRHQLSLTEHSPPHNAHQLQGPLCNGFGASSAPGAPFRDGHRTAEDPIATM